MTKFASALYGAGLHRREPNRKRAVTALRLRCVLLILMAAAAHAQSVPVQTASPLYTPFSIPKVNGTLQYSISGSAAETFGYEGGSANDTGGGISGNLAFIAPSVRYPSSVVYSGGFSVNSQVGNSPFFQNLTLSQGIDFAKWRFNVSDAISYLPYTATTGLSGIPGVGDVGVSSGTDTTQQILTVNATRIGNAVSGTLGRSLTGKTSLSGSASYSIQRFLGDSNAIESDSLNGGGSLSHRIDARTSISGSYFYNRFTYAAEPEAFTSQGATFTYARQLTPHLNVSLGAGPQFIGPSDGGGASAGVVGVSLGGNTIFTYSADMHLSYTGSSASAASLSASYVRSSNSGSGTGYGTENDSYSLSGSRRITRSLQPSVQISFTRSVGLALVAGPALETDAVVGSTQINRALSRVVSVYASYTAEHQTYSGSFQGIEPVTGLIQILAFGVTYSPASIHVGRRQ